MSEARRSQPYSIQLGHTSVEVHSVSPEIALSEARRRLSLEYPRLWDVIHAADDDRVEDACKPLRVVTTIQRGPRVGEAVESLALYDRSMPGECAFAH